MERRYARALGDGRLRCGLCHHGCVLAPGAVGVCRVRANRGGTLELPYRGAVSSVGIDPIEKKPLYHFLPGTSVFSVGYLGCNLKCPFCQNFSISQSTDARVELMSPESLVDAAVLSGCPSLAHTYSEPLVHAEFVAQAMALAREKGLKNVLVTNGCAREEAARDVLERCDAVNVDLKTWDAERYRGMLGGDLDTVKAFLALAVGMGVHVEATTLVVPGLSDDEAQVEGIAAFLASLSPAIALHLSAYRPMYRYHEPATGLGLIGRLAAVARRDLPWVYEWTGGLAPSVTACRSCGAPLVVRHGYRVDAGGLSGSVCRACGAPSPVRNG